jgi:hypothetical protein
MMQGAAEPDALQHVLRRELAAALAEAPDAAPGSGLAALLEKVFRWTPPVLEVLAEVAGQWDRMGAMTLAVREAENGPLVALSLRTAPGKEVVLRDLYPLQPEIALRGAARITVQAEDPWTGETVVRFDPVGEGGAIEVRFEGLFYGLVRTALPVETAALRQVRVARGEVGGKDMTNVVLLLEALKDENDPRRVFALKDVQSEKRVRSVFQVESEVVRSEQTFTYLTPERQYTYERVTTGAE